MARTPSNMLALGTKAPEFSLLDVVSNKMISLRDLTPAKGYLIMFICNHCPYVKHVEDELILIGEYCRKNGISVVAISSNDVEQYPADGPEKMKELALEKNYPFPYLFDQTQEVAKAYEAACTPDFYLFNDKQELIYRGQLDDSRPKDNATPVTGKDLREAISNLLSGRAISSDQKPSLGCNIKWK